MERYIIYLDAYKQEGREAPVLALRYDYKRKSLFIGGYTIFRRSMYAILRDYFGVDDPETCLEALPSINKMRITVTNIATKTVYDGMDEMERNGIMLTKVTTHKRIMS